MDKIATNCGLGPQALRGQDVYRWVGESEVNEVRSIHYVTLMVRGSAKREYSFCSKNALTADCNACSAAASALNVGLAPSDRRAASRHRASTAL